MCFVGETDGDYPQVGKEGRRFLLGKSLTGYCHSLNAECEMSNAMLCRDVAGDAAKEEAVDWFSRSFDSLLQLLLEIKRLTAIGVGKTTLNSLICGVYFNYYYFFSCSSLEN